FAELCRRSSVVMLLAGAVVELYAFRVAEPQLAVDRERRRLARDLHDGAVQEIGYIWAQTRRAADDLDALVESVRSAAERALHEARHVVTGLTAPIGQDFSTYFSR